MIFMEDDIIRSIEALRTGGIILYPTDTIWGIGCDATNEEAVRRIYKIKQREESKALLVLVDSFDCLCKYVNFIPEMAQHLVELSDKPLTIIYDNAVNLASNLLGENNSVGIRITNERFSHELCQRFRRPIVSTSANISGMPSPSNFSDISEQIKKQVDYIVKYRQDDHKNHSASSIIKLASDNTFKILRP